jgi:hypothetical protein
MRFLILSGQLRVTIIFYNKKREKKKEKKNGNINLFLLFILIEIDREIIQK